MATPTSFSERSDQALLKTFHRDRDPVLFRELVVRYLQGKSNAQVASELQVSQSAVEGRLKRGRNQLRLRLAPQGVAFTMCVAILCHPRRSRLRADDLARCGYLRSIYRWWAGYRWTSNQRGNPLSGTGDYENDDDKNGKWNFGYGCIALRRDCWHRFGR